MAPLCVMRTEEGFGDARRTLAVPWHPGVPDKDTERKAR